MREFYTSLYCDGFQTDTVYVLDPWGNFYPIAWDLTGTVQ